MKLCLLMEHFVPARGGLENWGAQFVRWMSDRGHALSVVAIDHDADALPAGATFHALPTAGSRFERAAAAAALINTLDCELVYDLGVGIGADIYHTHFGSRVACEEAELRSRPTWHRVWKTISPAAKKRRGGLAGFEAAQFRGRRGLVIAPSRFAAKPLSQRYGVREEELRIVCNGVDTERFSAGTLAPLRTGPRAALKLSDGDVLFVQVAMNFQLKGVDTAIRALAQFPPNAKYAIVGGGQAGAFKALARRLGVQDRVHFAGMIADPRPWFAAADASVHATRYDAGSISTMEAWASGLPVVTTRTNGAAEVMEPGREGFVIDDPNNAAALADAMRKLLYVESRARMGGHARRLAEKCSFENQAKSIEAICQDLVAAGSATGRLTAPVELRS